MRIFKRKSKNAEGGAGPSSDVPTKPPSFTRGIKVLYTCEDAVVDICFVHGLTGDREDTWTAKGQNLPWPQTLLPPKVPKARILTFGYDAYVARAGTVSTNGVVDHAMNLVNDLVGNREEYNATSNGLIFVAHSLGGLVCKSALEYSRSNPGKHLRNVFDSLIGIVFFGTPHRGSWMANWAKIPVSTLGVWQAGNTKLIDVLRTKSEMLETIRDSFSRMIWGLKEDGRDIKVTCFYEEVPLSAFGLVVDRDSAVLESSLFFSIHKDHRNMVKFASDEDDDFDKLVRELKRWIKESTGQEKPAKAPPVSLNEQSHHTKLHREPPRLVPTERNSNFAGRAQDLERLREMAAPKEQATTKVAIAGLGGIGKTQLALEYVYEQGKDDPDCAIFWISCVSRETIDQGYLAAIHALGDDGHIDKTDKADDLALQKALRDRLSRKDSGRWILVLDNVDDMDFWVNSRNTTPQGVRGLIDCLPRSELGTIIFTTRDQKIAVQLARQNIVKLAEMDEADNRQLLQNLLVDKTLMGPENKEDVEKLLGSLMCLPLAIAQAAHYININDITISDYLGLFAAQEEQTIELLGRDFEDGQQPRHPVATTWLISFKKIKTERPLAADYISFMACTDFKDIPEQILPPAPSQLDRIEAIGTLKAYSFVSKHRDQADLLSMHRLVHLAARNWLRIEKTLDAWMGQVTNKLIETLYDSEHHPPAQWRPTMPHAYYVLSQRVGPCQFSSPAFDLLYGYARCLLADGRYRDAERYLMECLDICNAQGEASHPKTISVRSDMGVVYKRLGRLPEAAQLREEILQRLREIEGPDHPATLAANDSLVDIYTELGRLDEATRLGEATLGKRRTLQGAEHPNTLKTMANLVAVYIRLGWYDKAAALGEEALQTRREIPGADYPIWEMSNLAYAYYKLGRLDEATKLGEEALSKARAYYGDSHPDTVTAMSNLESYYLALGRVGKAAELAEEALRKRREIHGDDHRSTLYSMSRVGSIYIKLDRTDEALELIKEALERSRRIYGDNHPDTLRLMNDLGMTYQKLGRLDDAATLLNEALQKQRILLGDDRLGTLTTMTNLGFVYFQLGRVDEAAELEEGALEKKRKLFGDNHPDVLLSMELLSRYAQVKGEQAYALELMEGCVAASVRRFGADHKITVARKSFLEELKSQNVS